MKNKSADPQGTPPPVPVRAEVEKNPDVPREYIQSYLNGRIVGARRVAMMELLGLK